MAQSTPPSVALAKSSRLLHAEADIADDVLAKRRMAIRRKHYRGGSGSDNAIATEGQVEALLPNREREPMSTPSRTTSATVIEQLIKDINAGAVAVLCGAGISRNSGLPIVADLEGEVLATLRVPNDVQRLILESSLPFEAFIEVMRLLGPMEDIYAIFDLGKPNANHRVLAHLMKSGKVRTVVTTNFDVLIERALETVGMHPSADYDLRYLEDHFAATGSSERPRLIKIHGSAHDPYQIAITLERVASGRASSTARSLGLS